MKKLLMGGVLLFAIASLSLLGNNEPDEKTDSVLILGYCPTFQDIALEIAGLNEHISVKNLGSTALALENLNSENIDIALVGRKAFENEVNGDIVEKSLAEDRYTLVSSESFVVNYQDLVNFEISAQKEQQNLFPEETVFTQESDMRLILWEDFAKTDRLVIPVHEDGSKVRDFRSPFIYTRENIRIEYPSISL